MNKKQSVDNGLRQSQDYNTLWGIMEEISTLRCVLTALQSSTAVDESETLCAASIALGKSIENLHSLYDDLSVSAPHVRQTTSAGVAEGRGAAHA